MKFFLCLAVLMTIMTTRWEKGNIRKNIKKRTWLVHLLRAYAGCKYHRHLQSGGEMLTLRLDEISKGDVFLDHVESLHRLYWSGAPAMTIPTIMAMIDQTT